MVKKVTHKELKEIVNLYYETDIKDYGKHALFIWGRFGIGKSFIVKEIAQEKAKEKDLIFKEWAKLSEVEKEKVEKEPEKYFILIDIRLSEMDSTDIKGLPIFTNDNKAIEFKTPRWALFLENSKSNGFLFFDEINLAIPLVMSSCYKIIYDRVINEGVVNKNWLIMGAGNTTEDNAPINEIAPPLKDRAGEVELLGSNTEDWIEQFALKNNFVSEIIGYLTFKESSLYKVDFEDTQKFTTYRGWERLNNLIKNIDRTDIKKLRLISSTAIGEGISEEFTAFCNLRNKIDIDSIIKNPKKLKDIKEIDILYFLISSFVDLYTSKKINFNKIIEVSKVLDKENKAEFVTLLWKWSFLNNKKDFVKEFTKLNEENLINKYGKLLS